MDKDLLNIFNGNTEKYNANVRYNTDVFKADLKSILEDYKKVLTESQIKDKHIDIYIKTITNAMITE